MEIELTSEQEAVVEVVRQERLYADGDEGLYVDSNEIPGLLGAMLDDLDGYHAGLVSDLLELGVLAESPSPLSRNYLGYNLLVVADGVELL